MATQRDPAAQDVLTKLLEEHELTGESLLYREAERAALTSAGSPGSYRLPANATPSESVVDVYGPGYVVQAEDVGPGLAFTDSRSSNWQETMELRALRTSPGQPAAEGERVLVEVRLKDLLLQGGLMYPVESVMVEQAWYFTLPAGSIEVKEVA